MAFRNPIKHLAFSAITGQITGSQIANGAIGAPQLGPGAVTAPAIGTAAITKSAMDVGSVDYRALAIGTGNLVPDPSFEGTFASRLAVAPWSIETPGNNSAKALRVDMTAGAPTTRNKFLVTLPINPGDKLFLAIDYKVSAAWTTGIPKFYVIWRDSSAATLGFGVAQDTAPVPGGPYKRIQMLSTAPANAVTADVFLEGNGAQSGTLSWDNAEIRTALVAGAVSAGIITAGMLAADSIDGKTITGAIVRAVRGDGSVAALMAPDLGDGNAGFATTNPANGTVARLEAGQLSFYGPGVSPAAPAFVAGDATNGVAEIGSGQKAVNHTQARMVLASGDSDLAMSVNTVGGGAPYVWLGWDGGSIPATADLLVVVDGVLMPNNVKWGTVTVNVTTANTPASVTVTGLGMSGNTFRGLATVQSSPAGVTGVGVSSISRDSAVIWANKSTTGTVTVGYQISGVL
jgi:hypothetical protein